MFKKPVQYLGALAIFAFCSLSILIFQLSKDLGETQISETYRSFINYPSYFEDQFYDFRMSLSLDQNRIEPRLVLAAIDDKSLSKIGKWPWTRTTYVEILRKLKLYGAKVVSFDVVFSEDEKACGAQSPDISFAKAIQDFQQEGRRVILPYSIVDAGDVSAFKETPGDLYNFILNSKQSGDKNLRAMAAVEDTFPIPRLMSVEPGIGYIGAKEDRDGIFRYYPLLSHIDSMYFPSFGLLSYEYYTGDKPELQINSAGEGVSADLKLKFGSVPLNFSGGTKIRWLGGLSSFPVVPMHTILSAKDDDVNLHNTLKDTLVFIGSTGFGAHDLRHTPVDAKLPGIIFHMNMVQMLLDARIFQSLADSFFLSWGLLIIGTLLMFGISLFGNPILDVCFMLTYCFGVFFLDSYYLLPAGYQVTLAFVLFSVVGTYSWNTIVNFYQASKDKQFLKGAFSNYISPELIDIMYESGEKPKLGGDVGQLTAYFTDIQGFSSFSEKLTAPQLVELLNEYLTAMTDILLDENGTLDKYEGDAIIAFFGAPMKLEDHAVRAVRVANRMQLALLELRKGWVKEGEKWPQIVHDMRMRIGINSGEIVTGNMGSRSRMNYTMMGDSVNLAARLEEAAKQYGIFTQLSSMTAELLGDHFELRELDTIRVVGKSEPVTTYDLLGETGQISEDLKMLQTTFHAALDLYKAQNFVEAKAAFELSLKYENLRFPDLEGVKTNPSLVYLERCEEFIQNAPEENWDGVYTLTSK